MYHKVLVPLDGSDASEHALRYALQVNPSWLRLLRVTLTPGTVSYPLELPSARQVLASERDACRAYLERLAAQIRRPGLEVSWVVHVGEVAGLILMEAEQEQVDLVVMTSHGRCGFSRFALGSVAEKVSRHSPCPVMIIRHEVAREHVLSW